MRIPLLSCATAAALLIGGTADAQSRLARLQVRAWDPGGAPVAGAAVRVSGVERVATTDSSGTAVLEGIPAGTHWVDVFKAGFNPERVAIEFTAAANVEIEADLDAIPVEVSELIVTARNQSPALRDVGFYDRERQGLGSFVGAEALKKLGNRSDLYRALQHLRGFAVGHDRITHELTIFSTRGVVSMNQRCVPDVLVDGMPVDIPYLSNLVPSQIEGIEAYSGPGTTPAKLVTGSPNGATCGAVAIWLKH